MVDHIIGEIIKGLAVCHVQDPGHQAVFTQAQFLGGLLEAGLVNVGKGQLGAGCRQFLGQGTSNAGTGPGNNGYFILEILHDDSLVHSRRKRHVLLGFK